MPGQRHEETVWGACEVSKDVSKTRFGVAVSLLRRGFSSLSNARRRALVSPTPVQSGFAGPSIKIAPRTPYHAKRLPSGMDDPGEIPRGFAKEKKIFIHPPWLREVSLGVLTTHPWAEMFSPRIRLHGEGAAGMCSGLCCGLGGCGGCEEPCTEQDARGARFMWLQ